MNKSISKFPHSTVYALDGNRLLELRKELEHGVSRRPKVQQKGLIHECLKEDVYVTGLSNLKEIRLATNYRNKSVELMTMRSYANQVPNPPQRCLEADAANDDERGDAE
ncbi:hypothetical protein RB195_001737 [Necator americanus]|uniref:Uncharacterized protein n=1 Tax=Necator americanus TaxID=51031 RepID=A0ABR1DGK1_NECAM